jgi:CubicO group peptidase (beta-lactamase class C family)
MLAIKTLLRSLPIILLLGLTVSARQTAVPAAPAARAALAAPASVGIAPERLERLHKAMQGFVDRREVSGIVTLIARDGRTVDVHAVGQADIEKNAPMKTDAIFRIASMSKPITSAAIMMLFEENKLFLSDPVSKFIPAFKSSMVLEAASPCRRAARSRSAICCRIAAASRMDF